MALNPVVFFRKYQKFWMAAILLMCMLSFVLCTGSGNDVGQWVMNVVNPKQKGAFAVKIDNVSYYSSDMHDLKQRRNLANDYMRKMCERIKELALEQNKKLKNDKNADAKTNEKKINANLIVSKLMDEQVKGGRRYFAGGVKLDDLVDFKLWLLEADRLKIHLDPNMIMFMLNFEFMPAMTANVEYPPALYRDMIEVVRQNSNVPRKLVWQALASEFRVRMAQLALASSQPELMGDFGKIDLDVKNRRYFQLRHQLYKYSHHGERLALSPAQLRDYYNAMRLSFDLVMVPVEVDDFKNQIKAPTDDELQAFFDQYKGKPYNPMSDEPGFEIPEKVRVSWITANTEMPYYQNLGKVMAALEIGLNTPTAPTGSAKQPDWSVVVPQYNPMLPGLLNVVPYAAAPAVEYKYYEYKVYNQFRHARFPIDYLDASDLINNSLANILAFQGQRSPAAISAFVGALAQPEPGFAAPAALLNVAGKENEFEDKALARSEPERHKRNLAKSLPEFIAPLVGLGDPLTMAAAYRDKLTEPSALVYFERMPLSLLPELKRKHEKERAAAFVRSTMEVARKFLKDPTIQGKAGGVQSAINTLLQGLPAGSFEYKTTEKYYDRYTIKLADELKPLRNAFDDPSYGYSLINMVEGPSVPLKATDFDKLFFDKRSFSCAGGPYPDPDQPPGPPAPGSTHQVRQWPPVLTPKNPEELAIKNLAFDNQMANLFQQRERKDFTEDAFIRTGSPFLFWIAAGKNAAAPKQLAKGAELDAERAKFLQDLDPDPKKELDEITRKFKGKETELAAAEDELLERNYRSNFAFQTYLGKRQLRNQVIRDWKIQQARENKALPAIRDIATELAKKPDGRDDPFTLANNAAKKLREGRSAMVLSGIAPLMKKKTVSDREPVVYTTEFTFPKDSVLYPRDDMGQQLLMFAKQKPKNPVAIGYKELDALNADLLTKYTTAFDQGLKDFRLVQVFTNKPRDRFYIATVRGEPKAEGFFGVYKNVGDDYYTDKDGTEVRRDTFVLQAFDNLAIEAHRNWIQQLRKSRGVSITTEAEVLKNFDAEN